MKKITLGLKTLYRVVANAFFLRFKENTRLNFGAGGSRIGNYINVDSLFMRETDLLCKLKHVHYFVKENSVTHIYASHIMEHFSLGEVRHILKMSYKILKKNGEIRISVPDLDKIISIYISHKEEFYKKNPISWLGVIYGGQSSKYDFHKVGFNDHLLKQLLVEAGFSDVQKYDADKFLNQYSAKDTSLYKKDFGEYISLNMVAYK